MKLIRNTKYNDHKRLKEEYKKRLVAGIMAILTPLTAAGCAKNEDYTKEEIENITSTVDYDNNISFEQKDKDIKYVDADDVFEYTTNKTESSKKEEDLSISDNLVKSNKPNTNVFFGNRKSYYEYNNENLNSMIDEIKSISNSGSYDAKKYLSEELSDLKKQGYFDKKTKTYDTNYSWFSNNKIDKDKLYKKIINNNIKEGLTVNSNCKKLIKVTSEAVNLCFEYIKKNYPEFDYNLMLHFIDDIKVNEIDYEQNVSLYSGDSNTIGFNLDNIYSDEELLQAACHEVFHLSFNNNYIDGNYPTYAEGTSLDILTNYNTSLSLEFIGERNVDSMAYGAIGKDEEIYYFEENEKLELLSLSTGKNQNYFRKAFVMKNQNSLINSLEPELQDFLTGYSIFTYANNSCGYGTYEGIDCNDKFRLENFEKFRTLCLQNGYIRMIKKYLSNEITYNEFNNWKDNFVSTLKNTEFDYGTDNVEFNKNVEKLDNIVNKYIKGKVR